MRRPGPRPRDDGFRDRLLVLGVRLARVDGTHVSDLDRQAALEVLALCRVDVEPDASAAYLAGRAVGEAARALEMPVRDLFVLAGNGSSS